MKLFNLKTVVSLILLGTIHASALAAAYTMADFAFLRGSWLDQNKHVVLDIDASTINGKKLTDAGSFLGNRNNGSAVFVMEGNVEYNLSWATSGSETKLTLNGIQVLSRKATSSHFESIDGVSLGMKSEEVQKLYGEPTTKEVLGDGLQRWNYVEDKCQVTYNNDFVIAIKLTSGSKRKFDKSGYNCNQNVQQYIRQYMYTDNYHSVVTIASGEYVKFSDKKDMFGSPLWLEYSIYQ